MRLAFLMLLVPAVAHAQLRDPIPAESIVDGSAVQLAGGATADTERKLGGELATVITWTRAGVDRTEGFRGPRWTKRWGAALSLRAGSGSGDRPLDLEERGEVALYVGSVGQLVRWQSRSRLTDRFWYRSTETLELGAFVDFGGLGLVKEDHGHDLSAEGFPFYAEVTWSVAGEPVRTASVDLAAARVVGQPGDLRIIDEHITLRDTGTQRALALDAAALSARNVEVSEGSAWRISGALGVSALTPFSERRPLEGVTSIVPLVRFGIEHRGDVVLRTTQSEVGRPLVDDADFGVELATLHRSTSAGIDAGGQAVGWWQRPITDGLAIHGEAMFGVAHRQIAADAMPVSERPFVLARGEVGVTATLGYGVLLETRAWVEHTDRDVMRWQAGLTSGLLWRM